MEIIKIDTEVAEAFKINIMEVQDMVKEYQQLTLIPKDDDSYKVCRAALTNCIKTRTGIDKRRLKLNEEDQERIKGRNSAAKQLTAIITPAEDHLTSLVKGEDNRIQAIKDEEERLEREKIEKRIDALQEYRVTLPYMEIAAMTDPEFSEVLAKEKEAYEAEEARIAEEESMRKLEAEGLEKVRGEQIAKEAELAKIQADLAIKEKILEDERQAIENAKWAAIEKQKREKFEIEMKEKAHIEAQADAKEKVEREAREKIAREEAEIKKTARKAALAPDKDKLLIFADQTRDLTAGKLTLKSKEAKVMFGVVVRDIMKIEDAFRLEIDKM